MYQDKDELERHRKTWLTKECYKLLKKEKQRLKREEERDVSMQKIVNNLIIEKLGI